MRQIGGGAFLKPEQLLIDVGIVQEMKVADLGCGSGYMTLPAARLVGPKGVVYAVDVQEAVLDQIASEVRLSGLTNIQVVRSNLEKVGATDISPDSIDLTLLVNVLFLSQRQNQILEEAKRLTKPGGRMVVVDWKKAGTPFGPPPDQRVDFKALDEMAKYLGLVKVDQFEAGRYHYGVIYKKVI